MAYLLFRYLEKHHKKVLCCNKVFKYNIGVEEHGVVR
jgi:hypothetical protein